LSANEGTVILENNGIGYEITCSSAVYSKLLSNSKGEVYTYLAVRDDGISLYGFENLEEKAMFLKLISVSGVGPKMGITILSGLKLSDLAAYIANSDVKALSKIKGLGKKTAERIILELREKITQTYSVDTDTSEDIACVVADKDNEDAIIALMSLGFTKAECARAVKEAKESGAKSIEQLISYAIKHIK
jgi:Holliday junction DNA helicase RuvA